MPATKQGAPEGVARSTAWVLLSYAGTAGFTAVLTLYLVRALGPTQYGIFSLALGVGGLLSLPADLGIDASAARFIAERRGDRTAIAVLFASATRLKVLVAGAVALATIALAAPIAGAYGEPTLVWPLRAMAVAVLLQSTMGLFTRTFIAVGRSAVNLRMVVSEGAVECTASILLVALGTGAAGAAWGRSLGYLAGVLIGLVLAVRLLGRRSAAFHRRGSHMAAMGRYAGSLMIVNGAFALFSEIDVLLIGAILSTTAVGAFTAPLRLSTLLHYPGLALANSISPLVARVDDGEPDFRAVQRGLRLLVVLGALTTAPVIAWARPIIDLVLGSQYRESVIVLQAMAPFLYLQGIASLLSLSINYLGEAKRRIPVAILAVVVNAVIDLTLLRPLGIVAAAIGTSVAYVIYTGGHFAICHRLMALRLRPLALTLLRSLAAGGAMAAVLLAFGSERLTPVEWVAGALLSTLAFAVVLVATREVTLVELRLLARR